MKLMTNKLTILLVTLLATVSAASAMEQEKTSLLAGDENQQTQTRPNRSSSDARIVPSPFGPEDIGEVLDEIPLKEKESTESHTLLTDKPKQESLWQKPAKVLQNIKNTVQQKLSTSEKNKVPSKDTNPSSRLPKIAQKGLDTLKRTKDFVAKKIQKPEESSLVGEADHFVNQPKGTQEEINASIKFLQNFDETKNVKNVKGANYGASVRMSPEELEQTKQYLASLQNVIQGKEPNAPSVKEEIQPNSVIAPASVDNTTQVSELPIVETNLKSSIEEQKAQLENAFGFKDVQPASKISQPAPQDTVDIEQDELASKAAELKARREALELKKVALQAKRKALKETELPLKTSTSNDSLSKENQQAEVKQPIKSVTPPAVKRVKTPGKPKNNAQQPVQNPILVQNIQDHKAIAFAELQQALKNNFSNFPKAAELLKGLITKGYSVKDILKNITEFAPQDTVEAKLMFIEENIDTGFAEKVFKHYGLSDELNNGPAAKTTVTPASNVPAATKVTQLPVDPVVKKDVINIEPPVKQPEAPKATTPATKQVDQTPSKATQPASKDTTAATKATQPPVDPAVKGTQVPADQQPAAGNNNANQPQPLVLHADVQQILKNNEKVTFAQLMQDLQDAGFSPVEINDIQNNGIYTNNPYSHVHLARMTEANAQATDVMKKTAAKIRELQLVHNPSLAKLVGSKSVVEFENELADYLTKQCGCNAVAANGIITALEQEGLQSQVIQNLKKSEAAVGISADSHKAFIAKIEQLEKLDVKKPSKFTVMNKLFIVGGLGAVVLTAGAIWKAVEYLRGANIKKTEAALNELEQLIQDANSVELLAEQYPFIEKQLIVLDADAKSVLNTLIERQETDSILAAIAAHKKELAQLQKQSFIKRIAFGVKRDMQRIKTFFGFGKKQVPAAA